MMKLVFSLAMLGTMTPYAAHAQSLMEAGQVMEAHSTLQNVPPANRPGVAPPVPVVSPTAQAAMVPVTTGTAVASAPTGPNLLDDKRESLFFSHNQIIAIMRANQGFLAPKEVYDAKNQSDTPVDPGPRLLNLSGIVYHGANDWTIWFNGERITPKTIPARFMKLSVMADKIQFKWLDYGNQRIINLTLYPHQEYNIDTNVILPSS